MWPKRLNQPALGWAAAIGGIGAATLGLKLLGEHINPTTVALAFLLIIIFVATA